MTSRLDRLFVLLDTGSSAVTRKAAAIQLGEVQKLHPHELHNLLSKLHQYLQSSQWDTRIAAGQAVEAIISNVPQWNPQSAVTKIEENSTSFSNYGRMKFTNFDINNVLRNGASLLASEGKDYEAEDECTSIDQKEKLAKQRQLLNSKLGLDVVESVGFDTSRIFSNEDLVSYKIEPCKKSQVESNKKAIAELINEEMAQLRPGLSSREINRAKRKAKAIAKQRSKEAQESAASGAANNGSENEEPEIKKARTNLLSDQSQDEILLRDSKAYNSSMWEETCEWPLEGFCDHLSQDLFSPRWEIRHGSATALREIVKIHGEGAGKSIDIPQDQMEEANQQWLEDMALRLLCVLALDKFGDFISDQVVAPVRETCAQTLALVLNFMSKDGVLGVVQILLQLLEQKEWEARHGGLLGLKYLLAVRNDMTSQLLPSVFSSIFKGLQDSVDDVSAVAAAALVPISDTLVKDLPHEVPGVVASLWDSLLEQDDLTTSTNSIMTLLASLLSYPISFINSNSLSLNKLLPRLWPFLGHSSSSVRKRVLQTLCTLTSSDNQQSPSEWILPILEDFLRHIFQRIILEHVPDLLSIIFSIWKQLLFNPPLHNLLPAACPQLSSWLCLMMQPSKIPISSEMLIEAKHKLKDKSICKTRQSAEGSSKESQEKFFIAGCESLHESQQQREQCVVRARCFAAKLLGILSGYVTKPMPGIELVDEAESPINCYAKLLLFHLNSKSALQRMCIALVITEWAKNDKDCICPEIVKQKLLECLSDNILYDEIGFAFTRMQQECRDFLSVLRHHKLPVDSVFNASSVLTMEQAVALPTSVCQTLMSSVKLKPKVTETLEERRRFLLQVVNQTIHDQTTQSIAVQATVAGAVIATQNLPDKLNPVIKPLMDAIRKEENAELQMKAAKSLTKLLDMCIPRSPCPNPKIIKNLCSFVCADPLFTPHITQMQMQQSNSYDSNCNGHSLQNYSKKNGILTLLNQQKIAEKLVGFRRSNSVQKAKSFVTGLEVSSDENFISEDEIQKQNELQRRGAQFAITEIAGYFGSNLPKRLPKLWEAAFGVITENIKQEGFDSSQFKENDELAQDLVNSFQIFEVMGPAISEELFPEIKSKLQLICLYLEHPYVAIRHMAARCLGMLSKIMREETVSVIFDDVLPMLGASDNDVRRQGAIEALANIIDSLGFNVVPYIILLIVPCLGRMSDQNQQIRLMATHCFATLIRLMPLEGGIQDPPKLNSKLKERREKERRFLEQLLDTKKLETYKVPIPIHAELRAYQQDGVNWLAFLNKYKLHGILCDDMGLGKTLQSICILAGDHYYREQEYKETKGVDCVPLPSLVVCPPTLTGHWVYEIEKFVDRKYLQPLHYTGPPTERHRLRSIAKRYNLVIASYDIVRNDIDFFSSIKWNYCILDEGHIIKNGKTKLSKAIKQLTANHRLMLSGTPIQNNVLELWSLFDFLMPGFLGTEKQFTARYSKPILQSRDAKSSSQEQEAGALAMESLHRQVLPFLLRRMKEDVLQDLPPKIIQDYYCELSPLQQQLYEDFAKSRAKKSLENTITQDDSSNTSSTSHIFQALQYLRKVCNHPKLVLNAQHPEFENVSKLLQNQNLSLSDIQISAKLPALKQLLLDCGIGIDSSSVGSAERVVNQHRALIFCQLKSMLDILENDLFKIHLPNITYLRLDGSIPAGSRYSVVHSFNNDPSIDVLLLTTQVGGLGLNLTGADTVIFIEHDWNPTKDLQAMDRAHRIGQKKVVNVYRLITKGTLEEKIMGLQKFKLTIANTVINQENSSLMSMGTEQLLDLFELDDSKKGKPTTSAGSDKASGSKAGIKNILESLPDLWDDKQYEAEYDLSNFMKNLRK